MSLQPKLRSNDLLIQQDEYLSILKRFNIPSANIDTFNATGVPVTILFNRISGSIRIYDGTIWKDASVVDLTNYYNKSEIDVIVNTVTLINESQQLSIDKLLGLQLVADQANSQIKLVDGEGNIFSTLSVAFLNNEGTTFEYNETTGELELYNDQDELLSSIPVSAFVSNLITTIAFNGIIKNRLELRDTTGAVISYVDVKIENVENLQTILNGKEPTITILPTSKGGTGFDYIFENKFFVGGPDNTLIQITGFELRNLINAQEAGDYIEDETDPTVPSWVKSITEANILAWNNPPLGLELGTESNGLELTGNSLELQLVTITENGAMSAEDKSKIDNLYIEVTETDPETLDYINFFLLHNYISGSCKLYRNGVRMHPNIDYVEVDTNHLTLLIAINPLTEHLIVDYKK